MLPLHHDGLLWLELDQFGEPFHLPEGSFPVLAGINSLGEKQYVVSDQVGSVHLISEGEHLIYDENPWSFLLVLAWEPPELLQAYRPVPDDAIDMTGPFYWQRPYPCGGCGSDCWIPRTVCGEPERNCIPNMISSGLYDAHDVRRALGYYDATYTDQ